MTETTSIALEAVRAAEEGSGLIVDVREDRKGRGYLGALWAKEEAALLALPRSYFTLYLYCT